MPFSQRAGCLSASSSLSNSRSRGATSNRSGAVSFANRDAFMASRPMAMTLYGSGAFGEVLKRRGRAVFVHALGTIRRSRAPGNACDPVGVRAVRSIRAGQIGVPMVNVNEVVQPSGPAIGQLAGMIGVPRGIRRLPAPSALRRVQSALPPHTCRGLADRFDRRELMGPPAGIGLHRSSGWLLRGEIDRRQLAGLSRSWTAA